MDSELERLGESLANGNTVDLRRIREQVHNLTDERWLTMLVSSLETAVVDGLVMPPFPDDALQTGMVGSAGEGSIREAFEFYREVKAHYQTHGLTSLSRSVVLDFGCGWGRHLRFFLKDVPIEGLRGIDVDPHFIDVARNGLPGLALDAVGPFPPTRLADTSCDLVYAYSVFSHLAEEAHQAWISEFYRVLKPAGMLVVTTQPRRFIDFCALAEKSEAAINHRVLTTASKG